MIRWVPTRLPCTRNKISYLRRFGICERRAGSHKHAKRIDAHARSRRREECFLYNRSRYYKFTDWFFTAVLSFIHDEYRQRYMHRLKFPLLLMHNSFKINPVVFANAHGKPGTSIRVRSNALPALEQRFSTLFLHGIYMRHRSEDIQPTVGKWAVLASESLVTFMQLQRFVFVFSRCVRVIALSVRIGCYASRTVSRSLLLDMQPHSCRNPGTALTLHLKINKKIKKYINIAILRNGLGGSV